MTSSEFREKLLTRAGNAGVSITAQEQTQLERYLRLLAQWNAKINLTALPLRRPTDETFDRLLIEPLAAARYVTVTALTWFDVGSGGGSPAIPLKIAQPRAKLTMIESKSRKAAFLREAVRALSLADVRVENERLEEVADRTRPQSVDMVTVRAIKNDQALFTDIHRVLSPTGRVLLFHSPASNLAVPPEFAMVQIAKLGTIRDTRLSILKALFHVEQSG